ncbi:MAG TPA: flagellar biosynthesis protein FlhF [Phycisphaerae bacterium]|nr:flagellar biosynthesis protein FlhF [Phycisphaerae bacterium]
MTLKRYQAPTMAEALAEVKRDLGRDAVILHTRSFRKGGLLGFWGRWVWEVTASPNVNVPRRISEGRYVSDQSAAALMNAAPKVLAPVEPAWPQAAGDAPRASADPLASKVDTIQKMLESLLNRPSEPRPAELPAGLADHHARLVAQDVPEETVAELMGELGRQLTGQQLADKDLVRAELLKKVAGLIRVESGRLPPRGQRARVIALIGPTGVGKTTTIAKLAANYRLREGRKVGLLTIDTYRVAAVDQLRTYADIIEVPLRAVLTAGELSQAVRAMSDRDVVLIDTAGRSQNNSLRLSQLRSFLSAAAPDEVHLVLSATAHRACTKGVLEQFVPLGVNRLIVTKLDEAATFGVLLHAPSAAGKPLSYVTTGQGVPEDILPAEAEALAECVLAGRFKEEVHVG